MKFRKKPVVVEALQWNGDNADAIMAFCETAWKGLHPLDMMIPTQEGTMCARWGDWIIKGIKGEFYPCQPDIFKATYDKVEP